MHSTTRRAFLQVLGGILAALGWRTATPPPPEPPAPPAPRPQLQMRKFDHTKEPGQPWFWSVEDARKYYEPLGFEVVDEVLPADWRAG